MKIEQEALEFTERLSREYFSRRRMNMVAEKLENNISCIGTGENEIIRNLSEAKELLQKEVREYEGAFDKIESNFDAVPASESICVVYGTLHAVPCNQEIAEENLLITIVMKKTSSGFKALHIHMSHPDIEQEAGHCFVKKNAKNDRETLRMELGARTRKLENLARNIPGGAHQCANNENLTLLSMSDSFISMFGYSRDEIKYLFDDEFIKMIYPLDRGEVLKTTREQLKYGNETEHEYRVMCKGGSLLWVLDKGRLIREENGKEYFYCILVEITERKHQQEEMRLLLERHQVIMDQTTDIIFEWDIVLDTLNVSPNWRKKFGYKAIDANISNSICFSKNIYGDDILQLIQIMKDMSSGVPYSETEFRIMNNSGKYIWCRIRATAQFNEFGKAIKAVGVIIDIDEEKKQKQELLDKAQHDALTGLYNKAAINSLVKQKMINGKQGENQVLMIIDVDHFKAVNDTYGHLAGDVLLSDVAAALKSHVGQDALLGRIGGDEFMVYIPEAGDYEKAKEKAEEIFTALQFLVPERGAAPISCSIGAALFPRKTIEFFELYKCADKALYLKKNNGRGGVAFYTQMLNSIETENESQRSAVNDSIGSDENNVVDEQLAQYAFRTLYDSPDTQSAIDRVIEIIGRSYDVSRVYIYEYSDDGKSANLTYEWCNEGILPQKDSLQNVPYERFGYYQKKYNSEGVFYCCDIDKHVPELCHILKPQGIRTILQCAILDEGKCIGGLGFDECRELKQWNESQIASFKLTANVISSFVVKIRLKKKLEDRQIKD